MSKGAKPDAWMPLFVGDYLADTARLTTEQHGAYLLLIMDYWRNGAPPDDDAVLAQIVKLDRKAWLKHRSAVIRFFRQENGLWRHKRIDAELAAAQTRSDKAAERAAAAAEARWAKERAKQCSGYATSIAPSIPQAVLDECPSPSPSPTEDTDANASVVPRPRKIAWDDTFAAAWDAYPQDGKQRSVSRDKCWPIWREQVRLCGSAEALLAAVRQYVRLDKQHKTECGAPAFNRWLKEGRWEHWLAGDAVPSLMSVFPDAEVRYAVERVKDEAWVASWLDPCSWDAEGRVVTPRNSFAAGKLRKEAGDVLSSLGVRIEERTAA